MDTLDAQCLLVHLTLDHPAAAPTEWVHEADGSLACRFAGSPRTLTWPREDVARLAAEWRGSGQPVPAHVVDLVEGHRNYVELVAGAGLPGPDRVLHDLAEREVTAFYDEPRVAVVIGDEGLEAAAA